MADQVIRRYDLKKIRILLRDGFNDTELRRFCFDEVEFFRPVYDQLAQVSGKDEIIDKLIEYAERKVFLDKLLEWAKEMNPKKYDEYYPYRTTPFSGSMERKYQPLAFEIKISRYGPASYKAEIDSSIGQMTYTFQLPITKSVIEATLADFRQNLQTTLRSPQGEEYKPQSETALIPEKLGGILFESIFRPDVLKLYKASRQQAKHQGQPLPIILNIDPQTSDLINLPWEFLYDTSAQRYRGQFLAFDQSTPIIRRWLRVEPFDFAYDSPLRVLLVSASPDESIPLNVQRECRFIKDRLNTLNRDSETKVWIEELQAATLSDLKKFIRNPQKTPHIIHFMGHGGLGSLLLEDKEGGQKNVSEQSLAIILKNAPSLRLVVLNACQTARADSLAEQLGVAQALADAGIPAIVAMQFLISDKAALTFAEEFYQLIAEGHSIDAAVTWARIAIQNEFADSSTKEWATPVLYLQAPDGHILADLLGEQQKSQEPCQDETGDRPETFGQQTDPSPGSKTAEMRREAEEIAEEIERLQKLRREHFRRLREREKQAAKLGINADPSITLEIADIREDIKKIDRQLKTLDPEITFIQILPPPTTPSAVDLDKIDDSRVVKTIKRDESGIHSQAFILYTQGRAALDKGDWGQAVSCLSRAQKLSPQLPDVDRLAEQAREQWRQTNEGQNDAYTLEALYGQAQQLIDKDHERAASLLERIVRLDAGYEDAYRLAIETRRKANQKKEEQEKQEELKTLYSQAEGHRQAKNWPQTIACLTRIIELDDCYQDSQQRLNEAVKQHDLQEAYQAGEQHFKAKDWAKAIAAFGKVTSIDPDYGDADKLLALSRRQKQVDTWLQEVEEYLHQQQWQAAIDLLEQNQVSQAREEAGLHLHYAYARFYQKEHNWEQVAAHLKQVIEKRPNYRPDEVNDLYNQANEELRLQQQFSKAIIHIEQGEWAAAKATLEAIIDVRPDYPMAGERLEQVKQEIEWAGIYDRALKALELDHWAKAIHLLKNMPGYKDAAARMENAQKQLTLATFYQDGLEAAGSGRWAEAAAAFERIVKIDPAYRDAPQELQNARNKVILEQSFNHGMQAFQLGQRHFDLDQLEQAVRSLETVAQIEPRYRGVENRLHEAKRERFLLQRYQQGEAAYQAQQWAEAVSAWEVVVKDENEPDYHGDAARRLALARQQQRLAELYLTANRHLKVQEWDNVIMLLEELQQETREQGYKDADNLLAEAKLQQKLAQHYRQAEQLLAAEQWGGALQHLEQIQTNAPHYRQAEVEQMLEQAQTGRDVAGYYEAGQAALKAEHWAEAATFFDRAYKLKSDFRDVATRLRQARQQETLHNRYQMVIEALSKETWEEAIEHLVAIQGLDPDFKDARQKLEEAECQKQLAIDYQTALAHFEAECWVEARDTFADILVRQKDYKEAPARRDEAQQQLDMADCYERAVNNIKEAEQQPENWQLAVDRLAAVSKWQSDYRDTPSLLDQVQHQAKLYDLYKRATVLSDTKEIPALEEAIELLGQITKLDLNYRDATPLKGQYEAKLRTRKEEERRIKLRTLYDLTVENTQKEQFEQVLALLEDIVALEKNYRPIQVEITKIIAEHNEKYIQAQQFENQGEFREALNLLKKWEKEKPEIPHLIQGLLENNSPKNLTTLTKEDMVKEVPPEEEEEEETKIVEGEITIPIYERHTDVTFPEKCKINCETILTIQLTHKKIGEEIIKIRREKGIRTFTKEKPISFKPTLEEFRKNEIEITVEVSANKFEIDAYQKQMIVPLSRQDSNALEFVLIPQELGIQRIEIQFWKKTNRIGYIVVETEVVKDFPSEQDKQTSAKSKTIENIDDAKLKKSQLEPDARLSVFWTDSVVFYALSTREPYEQVEACIPTPTAENKTALQKQFINILKDCVTYTSSSSKDSQTKSQETIWANIRGLGTKLFNEYIPSEIREKLLELKYATSDSKYFNGSVITISSDDNWIPWELVYDGRGFWSQNFIVARNPRIPPKILSSGKSIFGFINCC